MLVMSALSKENAAGLARIIKETVGREVSPDDIQTLWRFVIKLLNMLRGMEYRRGMAQQSEQQSLFERLGKR